MDSETERSGSARTFEESEAGPAGARITPRSLSVPGHWTDVIDVLFDDRRVFSINPADLERSRGRARSPWPPSLRGYLNGEATVTLRSHLSREVLAEERVRFGPSGDAVRIEDQQGVPLSLDKWGALVAVFDEDTPEKELMLDDAEALLLTLNETLGMSAFVAYGTLLGAVRAGKVIGHDNDVDLAYYSSFEHPADVMRESLVLQRRLRRAGWSSQRRTGGFLQVWKTDGGTSDRHLDLFVAYHCDGWFSLHKWVRGRLDREAVLPLGHVTLEGRRLPAPRDPEAVLAVIYGENWRIPDPSFAYVYAPPIRNRAEAWFGGWRRHKDRWRLAVRPALKTLDTPEPSDIARYVDDVVARETSIIDVGSGAGHDGLWLARRGHEVIGLDYLGNACARASAQATAQTLPARFEVMDLNDLRSVLATATRLALTQPEAVVLARHVLEVLDAAGRQNFWLFAKAALGRTGRVFIEFYTPRAEDGSSRHPPAPFSRGLEPEQVAADVIRHGGRVESEMRSSDGVQEVCRMAVVLSC